MLRKDVNQYIELKKALGYKYRVQASLLNSFVKFSETQGERFIRTETVLDWAAKAPSAPQRRNRLLTVRRFAIEISAEDKRHQVPPKNAFGYKTFKRRIPYIFEPEEIAIILNSAENLKPNGTIRPATYRMIFGLLAATGLRISEALALQITDITDDGLVIRSTKFRKTRLVPIHETVRLELYRYLSLRKNVAAEDNTVFISLKGKAISYTTVNSIFLSILRSTGLRKGPGYPGPIMHDLRHTFSVRSLENCMNDKLSVSQHIVSLSTYLGHTHVSDTYWYLQATPTLMNDIAKANEVFFKGGKK
jgi:integrase